MKHMKEGAKVIRALLIVALGPGTPELDIYEHESVMEAKKNLKNIFTNITKGGNYFDGTEHADDWRWAIVYSDSNPMEMQVYEL